MASVVRTITVAQPVEKVWAYLADFTTTEEWDPPTVSTTRLSGDGGVGTTYRNVSKFLGKETEVTYEVVRADPNRVLELTGSANGMDLRDTIIFAEREGSTEVTYRSEFQPQGLAKLAEPLLDGGLEVLGTRVAKSLKEKLSHL